MSQLTLRLPQTLHQQLIRLAEAEGISLNQYIVYALSRQAASADFIGAIPEEGIDQQQQSFQALLQQLEQASPTEIESTLAEREMIEPEPQLSSEIIDRLQQQIRHSTQA